jgi:exopolyphosphatase/guanosine-5'-triphosphate,3'-diphosphate pyrophosphatase
MPAPPRAVIDCGTNTFHLGIVDGNNPAIQVFSQRIPVRIGEGGFRTQIIRSERLARALDALKTLQETCWNYGVEDISVVATSAVRDASNRDAFLTAAREMTGLQVVVLSGLDEARLIQAGVEPTCPTEEHGPWLTMDIGGGSVELVVWSSDPDFKRSHFSCDIGVGRLQDFGTPPDPLGASGAAKFRAYLEGALGAVTAVIAATPPMRLVGSSGSFETFADCLGLPLTDRTQAIRLPRKEFSELSTRLQSVDLSERLTLRGMAPDRAPFIALSAMLVDTMLAHLPADATVWASPAALREGVVRAGAEEGGLAAFLQSPHHTAP